MSCGHKFQLNDVDEIQTSRTCFVWDQVNCLHVDVSDRETGSICILDAEQLKHFGTEHRHKHSQIQLLSVVANWYERTKRLPNKEIHKCTLFASS